MLQCAILDKVGSHSIRYSPELLSLCIHRICDVLAFSQGDVIFRFVTATRWWAICIRCPAGIRRIYLDACARGLNTLPCQQPAVYRRAARKAGLTWCGSTVTYI